MTNHKSEKRKRMRAILPGLFVLMVFVGAVAIGDGLFAGDTVAQSPAGLDCQGTGKIWLESISFNHDPNHSTNDAINIRMNLEKDVGILEWEKGKESYPAVYIKDKRIAIKAVFYASPEISSASIMAKTQSGELGDCESKVVSFKDGESKPVYFWVSGKTPDHIISFCQKWVWQCQNINNTGSPPMDFGISENMIYIILETPMSPWGTTGQIEPWVEVLEKSCSWAKGAMRWEDAAEKITQYLYKEAGGNYDGVNHYSIGRGEYFYLCKFLRKIPNIDKVNCADMGTALVTLSNSLGCGLKFHWLDIKYEPSDSPCTPALPNLNCIKLIGNNNWQREMKFDFHAFTGNDEVIFDACLKLAKKCIYWCHNPEDAWVIKIPWQEFKKLLIRKKFRPNIEYSQLPVYQINISCPPMCYCSLNRISGVKLGDDFFEFKNEYKSDRVLSGIDLSDKDFELVNFTNDDRLLKEPLYEIEGINGTYFSTACQRWKKGNGQLDLKIVVGPTAEKIKEYLRFSYWEMSSMPAFFDPLDSIGNYCTLFRDKNGNLLRIDFVRNNVLISLQAKGAIREKMVDYATILDGHLKQKLSSPGESAISYEKLCEYPSVKVEIEKDRIKLGERVRLIQKVNNSIERKPNYFWKLSGGGIETNSFGDFFYYGSELGQHSITLFVTNSIGLLAISPIATITVEDNVQ